MAIRQVEWQVVTGVGTSDTLTPVNATNAANAVNAQQAVYDITIRTQEEFEALYNSPTWLGAASVLFVGILGGVSTFIRYDGQGLLVPSSVRVISGINNATITVDNFAYNASTNIAALYYSNKASTLSNPHCIDNLMVNCNGKSACAFANCANLRNCVAWGDYSTAGDSGYVYGFSDCTNLINCRAEATNSNAYAFNNCDYLTNCIGSANATIQGAGVGNGHAFHNCTRVVSCSGVGTNNTYITGGTGYAFFGGRFFSCCSATAHCSSNVFDSTVTFKSSASCDSANPSA